MANKWTQFDVLIPKKLDKRDRELIAQDIIDFVVNRTLESKDKNNQTFAKGYSLAYSKSLQGQIAGKKKGDSPNLKLTGEMLNSLELVENNKGKLTIGYGAGASAELLGRVEGNVRGTYGKKTPNKNLARDFLGITDQDKNRIIKDYIERKKSESDLAIILANEVKKR